MVKKILTSVIALDHFTTYRGDPKLRAEKCLVHFSGEIIGEDDIYLHIRSHHTTLYRGTKELDVNGDAEVSIHCVIKAVIEEREDREATDGEEQQ